MSPIVPFNFGPPDPPGSFSRPNVPYCLSSYSYSASHTCEEWELDRYFSDIDAYVASLQRYLNEFNDFTREVASLSEDAERYANCEAKEATTQHE